MLRFRNYFDWLVSAEMPTQQADHKIGPLSIAFDMLSPCINSAVFSLVTDNWLDESKI